MSDFVNDVMNVQLRVQGDRMEVYINEYKVLDTEMVNPATRSIFTWLSMTIQNCPEFTWVMYGLQNYKITILFVGSLFSSPAKKIRMPININQTPAMFQQAISQGAENSQTSRGITISPVAMLK